MTDTKQVTGIVQSITEATSIRGTYWKVALPSSRPGLKYPDLYNINKPEWMEGINAGVTIALDIKRGRAKKENPEYDNDYYWDVQGVKVLQLGGSVHAGHTEPWPGEELPEPTPQPAKAPKQPAAPLQAGNGHPKLGSEKLTPRERAMTLAIESWKGQAHSDKDLIDTANCLLKWLEG